MAAEEPAVGLDALVAALLARERLASTGFGGGLAMPHVRLAGIRGHHAVLGRVRAGLPFDALDGAPVHLLLLIVGPDGEKERYQRLMAHAARFLKSEGQALIDADDLQRATSQALASY